MRLASPPCPACTTPLPWSLLARTSFPWRPECPECGVPLDYKPKGPLGLVFAILVGAVAWGVIPDLIEWRLGSVQGLWLYMLLGVVVMVSERVFFLGSLAMGGKFEVRKGKAPDEPSPPDDTTVEGATEGPGRGPEPR